MVKRLQKSALVAVLVVLCLLLATAVLYFTVPMAAQADEAVVTLSAEEDFEIDASEEWHKVLKGLSDTGKAKIASVDRYAVELPVGPKEIAVDAFKDDTKLCSVTIPGEKWMWSAGEGDYYTDSTSYEVIGANAFSGCTSLESVIFLKTPEDEDPVIRDVPALKTLGEGAFANTALTSITIPATIETIGNNAFDTATLKSIVFEGSCPNYKALCSPNLTLKSLDISHAGYGANGISEEEKPDPIKFENGSTVYLPEAGDIYNFFLMETLYLVQNASAKVISDEFTSGMIAGLTVENIIESIADFKYGADGKVTYIENLTDDELAESLEKLSQSDKLEVTTVTFVAVDWLGREFTIQQTKLVGKSYRWELVDDEWVENENYRLPSVVDGVSVNPNRWTFTLDDDYTVNLDYHNAKQDETLYQRIYAHIEVPTDVEITYTGSEYELEGELARAATITAIEDADGNAVEDNKAIDAGTYTVHVALNNDADYYWDGERVDAKKYIWSVGQWTMGDETGKLDGAWVGVAYTDDDDNMTKYATQWATEYYTGGTLADGKLTGATKCSFNAVTPLASPAYIGTWNATDNVLENAVQITSLYGNGNWSAGSFDEVTFELVINKKTIELEWRDNGNKIEDVNNYTLEYSATATVDKFTAFIGDERITLYVGEGLTVAKDGVAYDKTVLEEGAYVFTAEHKNYDFINTTFGVRVNAQALELSNNIAWSAAGGALIDGTVYITGNSNNPTIHSLPHPGVVYTDIRAVKQSIVRYTGNAITLSITGEGYTWDLSDNVATESGIYTATATLTATAGYRFTTDLENDFAKYGITVTIDAEGKTAVVTKTWYIIELENELLDNEKSIAAQDWVVYSIQGWTFGDEVTVKAPRLVHGDEGDNWLSNGSVTFQLIRNDTIIQTGSIDNEFSRDQFEYYINGSMPAGDYLLKAVINVVTLGSEHTHWWNGEEHTSDNNGLMAHSFTRDYVFTVAAADMSLSDEKLPLGTNGYDEYTWELTAGADKELLFKHFADKINAQGAVVLVDVTRSGYWATEEADGYYGNHVVTYNLAQMKNETYLEASNNNLLNRISSEVPDTYTVYFQVTALNHNNLTDTGVDGRYSYFFTVTVFKTLEVPTVIDDGLFYTSNKVLPEIEESDLYAIVWSDTDAYITGGTHSVSFELYDNVHYRWKGESGDTVSVEFTIAKADNDFTTALNILGWNFETFDAAVNNIRAAVRYLDNGEAIHFRVVKEGETTALNGLTDFTVDGNGKVSETVAAVLNALKVGNYTLYAKVNGTGNYKEYERNIPFAVDKAMNSWADGDEDLKLPSWIVGKYDKKENPIVVNAAHGQVNIIIADINGKEYYNSTTGLNKLNDCEVGKYLLKAWVDETEDYAALAERTFTIEVLEKIGLPWWATLLITVGALMVAALIIFILWKKGVFQILTEKIVVAIRTKASVDATIASVRAAKKMEEGKQSVAEAKRRERIEKMRQRAQENRALPPEERAAQLEAKAQAEAERAEQLRAKSESRLAKAAKMRDKNAAAKTEEPTAETPEVETSEVDPETPTEE